MLSENIAGLNTNAIKILIKQGEIKLNGKKAATADAQVDINDQVSAFVPQKYLTQAKKTETQVKTIFSDKNILIVFKPRQLDTENNLTDIVQKSHPTAMPAHRLDRNTAGLVVFGKTQEALNSLFAMFKARTIEKFYLAHTFGEFKKNGSLTAFLKKDPAKNIVTISDTEKAGYKKIISQFKLICTNKTYSTVQAKPLTGRTHQLRAHLKHIGHPIVGDTKYSDKAFDSSQKTQCLLAFKIIFLGPQSPLEYLKDRCFEVPKQQIEEFYQLLNPQNPQF